MIFIIVPDCYEPEVLMSSPSFKQRVCKVITDCAAEYKAVFLDYDYLIYSSDFNNMPYYIVSAKEGNYKHLTGVNSFLSPYDFYYACLAKTLSESDFDFIKPGQSVKFTKGVVRSKIIALPFMATLFNKALIAEESFIHGAINCTLATADNEITMGFEDRKSARPKSLLKGNVINNANAVDVTLVLRRARGAEVFSTLVQGDITGFCSAFPGIFKCPLSK